MSIPEGFRERLIHLHYCSGGDSEFVCKVLVKDPELLLMYGWSESEWLRVFPKRRSLAPQVFQGLSKRPYHLIASSLSEKGIQVITVEDDAYPKLLKEIYDPPLCLYTKGNVAYLTMASYLAIVGTRWPSGYASQAIDFLMAPLKESGIVIVSGMAEGVDTQAHRKAMSLGLPTIAVLAFGFDHLYPAKNRDLYARLQTDELVVTEFPPYMKAEKWHFPKRNRLISGLCQAVLITEAKKRSGSLITADCAMSQNRDVFSIPGRIDNPVSEGTNRLIQQGAKLILTGEDLLNEFPESESAGKKSKEVVKH
ncbi:DNA-processing protein DprA [Salisediminibacterium selenitireducens]|uniref:DNA protecting protein DprA n=1 Tax=Bacillus selenitireducens (strain ATCC 700615 / DSM 15326 / MLS10) TaxID=439292 RepID=D6XTV4_BACIE|nr:DNA-processing protein DprA [Salisediminibacterium selenitireducens]ADH99240.1 DNA protecting protein DprA [[Bacillus] selenitireducens MLS10]